MNNSATYIKVVLAILFLSCLFNLPYGYFQFVRFAALVGFCILANQANLQDSKTKMFIYIGLALIFQPLIKISFGRQIWNIIDVVVGIGLILSIFMKPKRI